MGAVISEDMVNDGYQNIMNVDISQIVIDAMTEKYKEMPQLQCNFHSPFCARGATLCILSITVIFKVSRAIFFDYLHAFVWQG